MLESRLKWKFLVHGKLSSCSTMFNSNDMNSIEPHPNLKEDIEEPNDCKWACHDYLVKNAAIRPEYSGLFTF